MAIQLINNKFHKVTVEQDDDPLSPRENDNLGTMVCWHRNYILGDEQPKCSPDDYRRKLACEFDPELEARLERIDTRYGNGYGYAGRLSEMYRDLNADLEAAVNKVLAKHIVELPLYLYDHSGITMSTGSFSCQWDSGQVGFIYITRSKIQAEYGWKNLTQARREKLQQYLENEVKEYDQYLTGQVYGFKHETADIPEDWALLALLDAEAAQTMLAKYMDLASDLSWTEEDSCWGFFGSDIKTNGILEHLSQDVHHLAEGL